MLGTIGRKGLRLKKITPGSLRANAWMFCRKLGDMK